MNVFTTYYQLTKPGIVYGNSIATIAGYLFASGSEFKPLHFAITVIATAAVMASACVVNNMIDRDIDAAMDRTRHRALVRGDVSLFGAGVYAGFLGATGIVLLWLVTNPLASWIAVFGFVAYVLLYTIAKRYTVHSTAIGTLSGATPPVIGYVAVVGQIDISAMLLFALLVTWQMPHFFAIALYRRNDYVRAGVPVLSVARRPERIRQQMIAYTTLFVGVCVSLGLYGAATWPTAAALTFVGICWLSLYTGLVTDYAAWARRVFRFSLVVLLVTCLLLSIDGLVLR